MFSRKKTATTSAKTAPGAGTGRAAPPTDAAAGNPQPAVSIASWNVPARPQSRDFPGPRGARAFLRVAMERGAYADVTAHAKESLDAEVCGALAGIVCEDAEGVFVHVQAALRGASASRGKTHVTFTQETWKEIHGHLERDHPKLRMVGWYHSHPGFGVEFSEMDLFIQRHFFPAPTQLALVTDPLGGALAICVNTADGIQYLDRFWVEGREQNCQVPARAAPASEPRLAGSTTAPERGAEPLEMRLAQLTQAVDDLRGSYHRFLLFCGMLVALGVIVAVGYSLWKSMTVHLEPPHVNSYLPVPVQIGDKTVLLGVGLLEWKVPDELNAVYLKLEQLKRAAAEAERQAATNAAPTNATTATPPATPDDRRPPPPTSPPSNSPSP